MIRMLFTPSAFKRVTRSVARVLPIIPHATRAAVASNVISLNDLKRGGTVRSFEEAEELKLVQAEGSI